MHFLLYFIVSLLLITIQTTLLPVFPRLFAQYDLLIPFLAFLTLFRSRIGRLPVILISGSLMDLLSGGSVGCYLISYLFILLAFRKAMVYFHLDDMVLFQIVIVLSVIVENLIFWVMIFLQTWSVQLSVHGLAILLTQLVWALVFGPLLYFAFDSLFNMIDRFITGGLKEKI